MNRRHVLNGKSGFTLLELLMVVIIVGILASIALPGYLRVAERTRAAEALTILAAIRSAENRFRAADPAQQYSTDLTLLDTDIPGIGTTPASPNWTFAVTGTAAGSNAQATRSGATAYSGTIDIDIDTGATCTSNVIWGLTSGGC